jgi:hypothetical protein
VVLWQKTYLQDANEDPEENGRRLMMGDKNSQQQLYYYSEQQCCSVLVGIVSRILFDDL